MINCRPLIHDLNYPAASIAACEAGSSCSTARRRCTSREWDWDGAIASTFEWACRLQRTLWWSEFSALDPRGVLLLLFVSLYQWYFYVAQVRAFPLVEHDKTSWLYHIGAFDILSDIMRCHDATILVFRGKHERQGESHVLIMVVRQHDEVCVRGNYILLQLTLQAQWHHGVWQVWVDVNYEVLIGSRLDFQAKGCITHPLKLVAGRYVATTTSPSLLLFFDLLEAAGRRSLNTQKHMFTNNKVECHVTDS